ncbi:MAG: alkaline phosphatase family protein [Pseudomonadales bacterium]|nr:alkaline phosphatase family protein [Pseudomonadales bacterium]
MQSSDSLTVNGFRKAVDDFDAENISVLSNEQYSASKSKSKKLAMYVFIDAFGWEIYQKYGFLKDKLRHSRRLETTFGFSSAADPSILTGRYPDEHGHWSSFYYSPETSPFKWFRYLDLLPSAIFDRWRVRHLLSKLLAKIYGYTGYFELYSVPFGKLPYFDYLEKYDYFVPKGILNTDTIFDWCVENNINYYCSNWRDSEESIIKANMKIIQQGEIKMNYLYLPKLDGVMHNYGTNHLQVEEKIKWLEGQVEKVYEHACEYYDDVSLYVISDHGMADVTGSVDLIQEIEQLGLKFGQDYIAMYDSTMARFWFKNSKSKLLISQKLRSIKSGEIVSKEELQRMRVPQSDKKFGELFFLMTPGILINPSFMGLQVIPGMHGFHPEDKDSFATILSNREIDENINSITDIRKTMEFELADCLVPERLQ